MLKIKSYPRVLNSVMAPHVPPVIYGVVGVLPLRVPEATSILTQTLSPSTDIMKQEKKVDHAHFITT